MKDNIIRVKGYKNLFYDKTDKLYRVRTRCPQCDRVSSCRCFKARRDAEIFIDEGIGISCSSVCQFLLSDYDIEEIGDIMKCMNYKSTLLVRSHIKRLILESINFFTLWRLKWYIFKYTGYISEKDAGVVVDEMDFDYDYNTNEGESC